jgi:hypothetical protein
MNIYWLKWFIKYLTQHFLKSNPQAIEIIKYIASTAMTAMIIHNFAFLHHIFYFIWLACFLKSLECSCIATTFISMASIFSPLLKISSKFYTIISLVWFISSSAFHILSHSGVLKNSTLSFKCFLKTPSKPN